MVTEDHVWRLFFNGASRTGPDGEIVAGVGVVLITPDGLVIHRAYSLLEPCTNNVAEYNALIIGLQLARHLGVNHLEAYGDSKMIVNQIRGLYEVQHEDLVPYHQAAVDIISTFSGIFYRACTSTTEPGGKRPCQPRCFPCGSDRDPTFGHSDLSRVG
ncbi:ribonuclease HI family protein [Staphylococcus aureus]